MCRTYYVHLQEDHIVNAALHVKIPLRLCKQSTWLKDVLKGKHTI
jgi:hypothetical protein